MRRADIRARDQVQAIHVHHLIPLSQLGPDYWTRSSTFVLCVRTATRCCISIGRRSQPRRFAALSGSARQARRGKQRFHAVCARTWRLQHVSFPKTHNSPTGSFESRIVFAIAGLVPPDLGDPILCIVALGETCKPTFEVSPVPEVAIAEDDEAAPRKYDVRLAGESLNMDPVPKPTTPELTSEHKLAASVPLCACATGCCRGLRRPWP
jgi:hypothetical protein